MDTTQTIALIAALIPLTGVVVAITANSIARNASRESIRVAERTIYLSLVDTRSTWFDEFCATHEARQTEINVFLVEALDNGNWTFDQVEQRRMWNLEIEARLLFDRDTQAVIKALLNAYGKLIDAKSKLKDSDSPVPIAQRSMESLAAMELVNAEYQRVAVSMRRYLYVGDIQRHVEEPLDETPPWWTRAPKVW